MASISRPWRRGPTRWRVLRAALVNSVVGFIGPEYLYDGKQIIRAGLEDHFCGKLLGLPMGVDVCYTNHAEADQDDMDTLLTLLAAAGVNYVMGVPGADDVMLNYQSTWFHDALYVRDLFGLRPAPEFEAWLAAHAGHGCRCAPAGAEGSACACCRQRSRSDARARSRSVGRAGALDAGSHRAGPRRIFAADARGVGLRRWRMPARAMPCMRPLTPSAVARQCATLGLETLEVASEATERDLYLRRPDHGPAIVDRVARAAGQRATPSLRTWP